METMMGRGDTMTWTKDTPKKAGFYWYKPPDPDEDPQVLRVSLFAGAPDLVAEWPGYEGDYTMDELEVAGGMWAGPLLPPEGEGVTT